MVITLASGRLRVGTYRKDGKELYLFRCKHCSREWTTTGKPVGFVKSAYTNHEHECGYLTNEERRKRDRRDIRRWRKKAPRAAEITLNNPEEE